MRDPSDDEIVSRLLVSKGADESAFRVLVERNHHRVRRIAAAVLNYHCAADIDEATFDAFQALKEHFESEDVVTHLQGLLVTIAGRKACDLRRKQKREARAQSTTEEGDFEPPMSPEDWVLAAEENAVREDRQHLVRRAVRQLPSAQRSVVELRHFGCCHTLKDVAESLDITHEAARQRYASALKKLKQALGTPTVSVKRVRAQGLQPGKTSEI